jgi:Secretion system C-terminal sorting domain
MKTKYLHIAIILIIGVLSLPNVYAFTGPQKGSRLNLKPTIKINTTLTFNKGKSILPFSRKIPSSIDLKPAKTANLYFSSLLMSRNVNKATKDNSTKVSSSVENVVAQSNATVEPGEKFFTAEGLYVSNVYPNPADDFGNFDYNFSNNNFRDVKIEFFNVLGTPMNVTLVLDKMDKKVRVSFKEFSNGMYFYQLVADGKTLATKKLLVKHYN